MSQIRLSQKIYDKVLEQAIKQNQTPDQFLEEFLEAQFSPVHPYIEIIHGRSQGRAVVKGTNVGVDVIIGYTQAGYTPQEIAADILPHLTLAQIYDVLSYYEDHRAQIDKVFQSNTPEVWQTRLSQRLGKRATERLLGH